MFFKRFIQLCNAHNVKVSPLLKSFGMSPSAIDRWRNGVIPTGETLILLADRFNVSIDYLLCKSDDPTPSKPSDDDEFWEMRQMMLERPEMRVLFNLSKTANKKTLEIASDIIKQLKGENTDE